MNRRNSVISPLVVTTIVIWLSSLSALAIEIPPVQRHSDAIVGGASIIDKRAPMISSSKVQARVTLEAPPVATLASEFAKASALVEGPETQVSAEQKVGFPRDIPDALQQNLKQTQVTESSWQRLETGTSFAATFSSETALGNRVQFEMGPLPKNAVISFADQWGNVAHQTTWSQLLLQHQKERTDTLTFWGPILEGESTQIEVFLPGKDTQPSLPLIAARKISHLIYSPADDSLDVRLSGIGSSLTCQRDAVCDSIWSVERQATGMLWYTNSLGSTYQISAILLNNARQDFTPYLLTSGFIITNQTLANTIVTRWGFESQSCDSSLSKPTVWRYGGADLLALDSQTASALLLMRDPAPAGTGFSGWTTALNPIGDSLTAIHHPQGDLRKIASGYNSDFAACVPRYDGTDAIDCYSRSNSASDANFIQLQWTRGTAEPGSWGAGIQSSSQFLMGFLYTRSYQASCSTLYNSYVGRFDRAYANANFAQWLDNPDGGDGWTNIPLNTEIPNLSVGQGAYKRYRVSVPEGTQLVRVSITGGTGDADIFVGYDETTSQCRSELAGNEETCELTPTSAGNVYIEVYGWSAASGFTLSVEGFGDGAWLPIDLNETVQGLTESTSSQVRYQITVPEGLAALRVISFGGTGDPDLFVGENFEPTPYQNYSCISDNLGTQEACELTLPSGTYYISVYGFSAFSNVALRVEGLAAPDQPVVSAVQGGNGSAILSFSAPNSNGAAVDSYSASCEIADTLERGVYDKLPTVENAKLVSPKYRTSLSLMTSAAKLKDSLQLPKGAVGIVLNNDVRTLSPGDEIQFQQFEKSLALTVTSVRTTETGSTFITGETDKNETLSLLISANGSAAGRITLADEIWQISPTHTTGVAAVTSSKASQLHLMPFGDDMRLLEPSGVLGRAANVPAANTTSSTISVLMLYDPNLPDPVTTSEYLLQFANQVQAISGTGITFVATSYKSFAATGDPLNTITGSSQVQTWRDQEKADLVAWIGDLNASYGYCGVAWVPGANGQDFASQAAGGGYSVTLYGSSGSVYCTDETLAHELGHNLGAAHDRANSGTLSPYYPYAFGDGINGTFGTVMSYLAPQVGKYSSPFLSCPTRSCGHENYTDVVRALNNVRQIVADIYEGGSGTSAIEPNVLFGGSVSPSSTQFTTEGTTVTFTLTPDIGYAVSNVVGSCTGQLNGNQYTVTAGRDTCNFEAQFIPSGKSYSVNIGSTAGGLARPTGEIFVTPFDQIDITLESEPDYALVDINTSCPGGYSGGSFLTSDITSNCYFNALFARAQGGQSGRTSPLTVTGLTNNHAYRCRVTAANAFGSSLPSAAVLVVPTTTAPSAPVINQVQVGNEELTIRFTPGDTGGLAVTYEVTCGDVTSTTFGNSATVSGLQNDEPVSCTVTARNAKGSAISVAVVGTPESSAMGLPIWLLYEARKDR